MPFLIAALDGELNTISQPPLPPLSTEVNIGLIKEAIAFLQKNSQSIESRKK
ncbi:MAG: hypothetical protein K2Q14_08265 [Gammaproteobacteria bacterium]|nr:hypothetical protein [Gammaproteobacteria bacterium]